MAAMPFLMPVMPDQSDTCFSERKLFSAVIEQRHPLVKQAYDKLGTAKVQALKYHVGNIRRELVKGLSIGDDYKIVKMINDAFQKQTPIAKNKAKERLQEIYDTLGLQRKAKATDLVQ